VRCERLRDLAALSRNFSRHGVGHQSRSSSRTRRPPGCSSARTAVPTPGKADDPDRDHWIILYTAVPGTPDHDALRLLGVIGTQDLTARQ
jgi:hypothetical protein